ncbi:MAG: CBS domain-containing protein [Saprospiraceae bacterium]|jgi:CBS domain-containing protein|nr:CBS domain-containing protein [Saprospiraceae bacterium]MBK9567311.1 CBS domain-containing protein [Saprospiraceae bacterium]MBP6446206.1 CBS domain-containing protein [Saprospiraceae bacterium]
MMNLEVRSIMTKDPVTAHPNQSIDDLSQFFLESEFQQLPVVDHGKLVGLITSSDVLKISRFNLENDLKVKDVMTSKVVRITPKDKVGTAAELFADKRFKMIPVVNLDNELKGIVTAFDVIRCAFNEEYAQPILYQDVFTH